MTMKMKTKRKRCQFVRKILLFLSILTESRYTVWRRWVLLASAQPNDLETAQLEPVNVIDGDKGEPDADNKKNFAGAKALSESMRERGHNIRLMITSHTHWTRLTKGSSNELTVCPYGLRCLDWLCTIGRQWRENSQRSDWCLGRKRAETLPDRLEKG